MGQVAHGGHHAPPAASGLPPGSEEALLASLPPGSTDDIDGDYVINAQSHLVPGRPANPMIGAASTGEDSSWNSLPPCSLNQADDGSRSGGFPVNGRGSNRSSSDSFSKLLNSSSSRSRNDSARHFSDDDALPSNRNGLPHAGLQDSSLKPASSPLPLLASPRDLFKSLDFSARPVGTEPGDIVLPGGCAGAAAMTPPADVDDEERKGELLNYSPGAIATTMEVTVGGGLDPVHNETHSQQQQHQPQQIERLHQTQSELLLQHQHQQGHRQQDISDPSAPSFSAKREPGLRLPSFENLGIAAPRPQSSSSPPSGAEPHISTDDPRIGGRMNPAAAAAVAASADEKSLIGSPDVLKPTVKTTAPVLSSPAMSSPLRSFDAFLTPPADAGIFAWGRHSFSLPSRLPIKLPGEGGREVVGVAGNCPGADNGAASRTEGTNRGGSNIGIGRDGSADENQTGEVSPVRVGETSVTSRSTVAAAKPWIDGIIEILLARLPRRTPSHSVLSHALPGPSATGFIFPTIINAMQQTNDPEAETTWINVLHAITGKFNLADMPTSPPATPTPAGAMAGGEDYFTPKTFDSAVSVIDYQSDPTTPRSGMNPGQQKPQQPRSPRPIVRPSSIDLTIVERYIPPTSTHEFSHLFNPTAGSSLLVDRLVELNSQNGTLLFIYPTRAGGETFMRSYLSPLLDRALRSMAVLHNFPADFSRAVGALGVVRAMWAFDEMERELRRLCRRLGERDSAVARFHRQGSSSSTSTTSSLQQQQISSSSQHLGLSSTSTSTSQQQQQQQQQPPTERVKFTLLHAAKAKISPPRQAWSRDWWSKQEKLRIRGLVEKYASDPLRRVDDAAATPSGLVQGLLDEVAGREYPAGTSPYRGVGDDGELELGVEEGIEVGVFVVGKSVVLS